MRSTGPTDAAIMIVGEAPGEEEVRQGIPFVGPSGRLLDSILHSVGLLRTTCFVTNVCRVRPPENDISEWMSENKKPPDPSWEKEGDRWLHPHVANGLRQLKAEIALVRPRLIIALGGTPLWALTGNSGILKWRGSRLSPPHLEATVFPTLHPAAVLRQMDLLPVFKMDLGRAKTIFEGRQVPRSYLFQVEPTFEEAVSTLEAYLTRAAQGPLNLSVDIETRAGAITCIGFATSEIDAICIPLIVARDNPFYWTLDEEARLVYLFRKLLSHPNVRHIGQNYTYDCQYFYRHWHVVPPEGSVLDTMIGHHSLYAKLRKGLDFLSSMYCHDHVYWKDESKDWDPKVGEKQLWTYNCKDAVTTYEAAQAILAERDKLGMAEHFAFQQSLFHPVLRIMTRGVRIDYGRRTTLRKELLAAAFERQQKLDWVVGHHLNPKSPKKIQDFFYKDMRVPGVKHLKEDRLTTDASALEQISVREPLLTPVVQLIAELRSIGVFISNFIEAEPDIDGRMRSTFAIAGPITYRFSSYENAFGSGMNFQNLPKEEKKKLSRARDYVQLPNIRELFIPDPGFTFFDMDLDRADLQVVVWEAADADLKFALREGLDMHLFNAMQVWNLSIPPDELKESHPNYPIHKKKFGKYRQLAKAAVHATNYGVGDRKLAVTLGISVHEASRFRSRWFSAHPGIHAWHKRTETQALSLGYVSNPFGARLYILGRFDLPEALAWQPQSTVAGVINRALVSIDQAEQRGDSRIQLLLQVHDSLAGQFPTSETERSLAQLRDLGRVVVPYADPLIIPVGIKTSTESWGKCD